MEINEITPKKRSLGALRKAEKSKPRSPDMIGQLKLQRHTLEAIARQLNGSDDDEIVCNIAGWLNHDYRGTYLTIEVSPKFPLTVSRRSVAAPRSDLSELLSDQGDIH
jgi:hypothetical protein